MPDTSILSRIDSPVALRELAPDKLAALAGEIRQLLTQTIAETGGHLSSNLGLVETTLALHRVYDFSQDRLCFDVGHQCYTHKLVTGRAPRFATLRQKDGLTGFPNPRESAYDPLVTGHASTSISSAVGFAAGFRLQGLDRHAVAVVGDGAIGGGMCFEAMNHAGHAGENVLVVLNDNDMAIAETVGAFSTYLTDLRANPLTQRVREELRRLWEKIPLLGAPLEWAQEHILSAVKGIIETSHVFSALGFKYFGPIDGHDLDALERELARLKPLGGPRLLHVVTRKGQGFHAAAEDPETYHSATPFVVKGCGEVVPRGTESKGYTHLFVDALLACAKDDVRVAAITAAMPAGTGIKDFAETYPGRFFDVGICEAHGVAFAGALAKAGLKPVVAIYSTFLQRGYDQIIHDVAIQPGCNVVFMVDRAGLVGADGPTHHGAFDIAFLRHIPGMTLMAPRDGEELLPMLKLALAQPGPVAIRYPRGTSPRDLPDSRTPLALGKMEPLSEGRDLTLLAYGRMVAPAWRAAKMLKESGIDAGVVNARFAAPLDEETLIRLAKLGPVVTLEDHALKGGFGSAVAECLADRNIPCRLRRIGLPDRFIEQGSIRELDVQLGLHEEGICQTVKAMMAPELLR